jgi:hypothetical protein
VTESSTPCDGATNKPFFLDSLSTDFIHPSRALTNRSRHCEHVSEYSLFQSVYKGYKASLQVTIFNNVYENYREPDAEAFVDAR